LTYMDKTDLSAKFDALSLVVPDVSRETFSRLVKYEAILYEKSSEFNLIGPGSRDDIWHRHIIDSAQIFPLLPSSESTLIDIGTGAGFPGMVLSILGCSNVTLLDSTAKRCEFLELVSRETNATARIHWGRAEKVEGCYDVVTSRAVASLGVLLGYSQPLLNMGGCCVYLKGHSVQMEILEAENDWLFTYELKNSITHGGGRICVVTNIHDKRKKNDKNNSSGKSKRRRRENNNSC
jgi:16S rRNA (guanine527-N7)-methyltransferase